MARNAGTTVENNFVNGLVTEATGLNFPENAVTDALNVEFDALGSVGRRGGIDLETGAGAVTLSQTGSDAYEEFLWKGVAGDGQRTFLVQQIGSNLLFFNTIGGQPLSNNYLGTVSVTPFALTSGVAITESFCQFSSGLGYLIVTHPYCDPFYIAYNEGSGTFTPNRITIQSRDFRGVDPQPIDRLSTATSSHLYNLRNQGWSFSHIIDWQSKIGNYPSDYDVWWLYKSPDAFGTEQFLVDTAVAGGIVNNVNRGNSPAPKGSLILTEFYQDRGSASGVSGIPVVTSGPNRPSTTVFHAGRVFYSGVNADEFTSKVYFTQIIEGPAQFGRCYQENDPTAQFSSDLLASDGGVISILGAGRIYKIWSTNNSLLVFASQGVWEITGSQGIGFAATDYTVKRISTSATNSGLSFVDVDGLPVWWGQDELLIALSDTRLGGISVKSVSEERIKTFYEEIPDDCRTLAKGAYNAREKEVRWVYRRESPETNSDRQNYDGLLVWKTKSNSFSPWSVSNVVAAIRGISVVQGQGAEEQEVDVTDLGVVVTDLGVDVFNTQEVPSVVSSQFKYTVKYPTNQVSFAQSFDTITRDWNSRTANVGVREPAYFISGYRVRGDAMRDSQVNYITIWGTTDPKTRFTLRSVWDYAIKAVVNRWSLPQVVYITNQSYTYKGKKLKLRGHGKSVQFRVDSLEDYDFEIIGWSTYDTVNAGV